MRYRWNGVASFDNVKDTVTRVRKLGKTPQILDTEQDWKQITRVHYAYTDSAYTPHLCFCQVTKSALYVGSMQVQRQKTCGTPTTADSEVGKWVNLLVNDCSSTIGLHVMNVQKTA